MISLRTKRHADADLKLGRLPHDLAASLAALPSMSLTPFSPFLRALRNRVSHGAVNADRGKEQRRDREDGKELPRKRLRLTRSRE
jgi:hypothetical protein